MVKSCRTGGACPRGDGRRTRLSTKATRGGSGAWGLPNLCACDGRHVVRGSIIFMSWRQASDSPVSNEQWMHMGSSAWGFQRPAGAVPCAWVTVYD